MPSFLPSVCIDAVFERVSSSEAIKTVKQSGIDAFEFWGWWDRDLDSIVTAKQENQMQISACCTKFISLVDPQLREDYLQGLSDTIQTAKQIDCQTVISQVGDFREGIPRGDQHQSLVDGLRESAKLLEGSGITLVIEPLNELVNHAGYYLIRSDEAFEIIDKVNSPHVKVVFDIYHQQISEGHLIQNITANIDKIGHFHAAGNPGRHELTRGEIHYPSVFDAIRSTNFEGYVGLEYWPKDEPQAGLTEVSKWFN